MVEISSNKYVEIAIYICLLMVFLLLFIVIVLYINFKNKTKQQQLLLKTIIDTQENERLSIAREIHDQFSNVFNAITMEIAAIERGNDNSPQVDDSLFHLKKNMKNARLELRHSVRNLAPGNLVNHNWINELKYLQEFTERHSVTLNLIVTDSIKDLAISSTSHTNLFRICQELVNNAMKHAKATTITFNIQELNNELIILYEDNGIGFDYNSALLNNSFGLKSINARTKVLEGTATYVTAINAGTKWNFKCSIKSIL